MTAETVQAGMQYPNVVRVLVEPGSEEYDWFDSGNPYPWPGPAPAPADLTWLAPTSRADGSTLVPIDFYTLDYGAIGAALTSVQTSDTNFDIPGKVPGTTYRARLSATDTAGKTSQLSGFVYFTEPL